MAPDLPRRYSVSSSSSNEELVDSILSQAMDQVALDQIAALNTAHLGDDSALPDHLESRFRKLKSFPGAGPGPRSRTLPAGKDDHMATTESGGRSPPRLTEMSSVPEVAPDRPANEQETSPKRMCLPPPNGGGPQLACDKYDPAAKADPSTPKRENPLRTPRTASSSLSRGASQSPRLLFRSPSPPWGCCFGLSPKSKKKSSGLRSASQGAKTEPRYLSCGASGGEWDMLDDDELLADLELGTLSIKEQGRRMKRVLREQEKATREAEKIVEWVRQASARMEYCAATVGGMDELLSDEEKENRL